MRSGQTEAAVDLARLAGLSPGGVICEIMNEDGTMARVPQLSEFCRRYGIKMISVADLIRYRLQTETLVEQEAEGRIRTPHGEFEVIRYVSRLDGEAHLALVHGEVKRKSNVLVRVHSRCVYGDVFGSLDCECERSIGAALKRIVQAGGGVFIYLHQTGPGLRIAWREGHRELLAHGGSQPSPSPSDHHQPLQHEIGLGAQILADLGIDYDSFVDESSAEDCGGRGFRDSDCGAGAVCGGSGGRRQRGAAIAVRSISGRQRKHRSIMQPGDPARPRA